MPIKNDKIRSWTLKLAMLAMVFVVTHTVYAVDGIIIKSSKSSKSSFSNMKKTLNISLNSGFSYRDNKSFAYKKADKIGNYNNVISFQKGNVKIMMPYRSKSILQKFKTPEKPQQ